MSTLRRRLFTGLIVLCVVELLLHTATRLGWLALPSSTVASFDRFFQGEDPPTQKRLQEPDCDLIYRSRANVRITYPRVSKFEHKPTTYTVQTDEHGFRTPRFAERKRPGVFRIICLGDSSTLGMNVEDDDPYPQVLARLLDDARPGRFEVLNFGVIGYTSRQGLELIRQRVLHYEPDLIVFAFGTNDRFWRSPRSDDELIRATQDAWGCLGLRLDAGLDKVLSYRVLKRGASFIRHALDNTSAPAVQPRESLEGMRDNIVSAYTLLREKGAALLVLNTDFFVTDARQAIGAAVERTHAAHVDLERVFGEHRSKRTRQIEQSHDLPPAQSRPGMMLLRVLAPAARRVGVEWSSFTGPPSSSRLRDDGQEGDQLSGDGIWSGFIPGNPGDRINYIAWEETDAGRVKEFQPGRPQVIPPSGVGEIDTFGEFYLHSDGSHPDEEGHRLIAETLLPYVLSLQSADAPAVP